MADIFIRNTFAIFKGYLVLQRKLRTLSYCHFLLFRCKIVFKLPVFYKTIHFLLQKKRETEMYCGTCTFLLEKRRETEMWYLYSSFTLTSHSHKYEMFGILGSFHNQLLTFFSVKICKENFVQGRRS